VEEISDKAGDRGQKLGVSAVERNTNQPLAAHLFGAHFLLAKQLAA